MNKVAGDPGDAPQRPTARAEIAAKGRPVRTWTVRRARGEEPHGLLRSVVQLVVVVAVAFGLAMLVQAFIVKPFTVHQSSMEPTLADGDRILINRLSYSLREPERGDVVVFHSPLDDSQDLVKRVVGIPGDTISVRDGDLYVNGAAVDEPYLLQRGFRGGLTEALVPLGTVFVLGDNRDESGDSRIFGPISVESIVGCAFAVYWPLGHVGGL